LAADDPVIAEHDRAITEYIGEYLNEMRLIRDISLEDLAAAVGVSKASLLGYEKGKQRMSLTAFIRIAVYLNFDLHKVISHFIEDNNIKPLDR
jgi:transcriptional regulator with XRE-family HTH domain